MIILVPFEKPGEPKGVKITLNVKFNEFNVSRRRYNDFKYLMHRNAVHEPGRARDLVS